MPSLPEIHQRRREKLRRIVKRSGLGAILVTRSVNVTYLTGFTGEDSYLLLTPSEAILISDGRFDEQLQQECPELECVIRKSGQSMLVVLGRLVKRAKLGQIGFEADSLTVAHLTQFQEQLPGVEWGPTHHLVEGLREIKDRHEINEIRFAIACAEKAFAVVKASLSPEMTEKETGDLLETQIRRFGGQGSAFVPIVGVGSRAALPHAPPTDRRIGESDFVLIDWGALGRLYVSDLTRVLVTGRIPPKLERIYRVVLKANLAGIAAAKPGATCHQVDQAARKVIEKAGFGRYFTHSLGHGIGLEVHEGIRLAQQQPKKLKPGMVVTIEPGIYLPGWGGVRIEDDVLITRNGPEVLTTTSKEFEDCVLG